MIQRLIIKFAHIKRLSFKAVFLEIFLLILVCSFLSRNSHALEGSCLSTQHGHPGDMKQCRVNTCDQF